MRFKVIVIDKDGQAFTWSTYDSYEEALAVALNLKGSRMNAVVVRSDENTEGVWSREHAF